MRSAFLAGIVLLLSQNAPQAQLSVVQGPIEADVVRVVDGDTLDVKVMAWPDQAVWESIRIRGLDTPEIRGACQAEKDLAQAAKKYLQAMISENKDRIKLTVVGCNAAEGGGFGRCLANVYVGPYLASDELIKAGLARPNEGEKRLPWC